MEGHPYLSFNGQCEEAFKFYQQCLGGKLVFMMKYEESPMADQVPVTWRGKIIHATFAVDNFRISGADALPGSYQKPQGFSVSLEIDDPLQADRIFDSLSEKGKVQVLPQQTFWAQRFGMLVDQFGTPWMINCGNPVSTSKVSLTTEAKNKEK